MAKKGNSGKGRNKGFAQDCAAVQTALMPLNRSLHAAKSAKQDEFYTQYVDIQKEVEAYLEFNPNTFKGKIVYWSPEATDDPFESNFFKYFALKFNTLGLKKLITTSYDGSPIAGMGPGTLFAEYNEGNGKRRKPKAVGVIVDRVKDENNDGATDIEDVKLFLKRNGANHIAQDLRRPRAMFHRFEPRQDQLDVRMTDGEGEHSSINDGFLAQIDPL